MAKQKADPLAMMSVLVSESVLAALLATKTVTMWAAPLARWTGLLLALLLERLSGAPLGALLGRTSEQPWVMWVTTLATWLASEEISQCWKFCSTIPTGRWLSHTRTRARVALSAATSLPTQSSSRTGSQEQSPSSHALLARVPSRHRPRWREHWFRLRSWP